MKTFFHLFFGLLIPLNMLFMLASFIYFNIEYDNTKSIRLGVLAGFLIAFVVSFVIAFFLLIIRSTKKTKEKIVKKKYKNKSKNMQKWLKETVPKDIKNINHSSTVTQKTDTQKIERNIMLLMDKALAFDVASSAITKQDIGTLTQSNNTKGKLTVKIEETIIELSITAVTSHTAQVTLHANQNSADIEKMITYMKKKEYSFLEY